MFVTHVRHTWVGDKGTEVAQLVKCSIHKLTSEVQKKLADNGDM